MADSAEISDHVAIHPSTLSTADADVQEEIFNALRCACPVANRAAVAYVKIIRGYAGQRVSQAQVSADMAPVLGYPGEPTPAGHSEIYELLSATRLAGLLPNYGELYESIARQWWNVTPAPTSVGATAVVRSIRPVPSAERARGLRAVFTESDTPGELQRVAAGDEIAFELCLAAAKLGRPFYDQFGCSVAHYAVLSPDADIRLRWLELCRHTKGVGLTAAHSNRTVAHHAAWMGMNEALAQVAAIAGKDFLTQVDVQQATVAHVAAYAGHVSTLDFLMAHFGADRFKNLRSTNCAGLTIAHIAALNGHANVFEWIAQHLGADALLAIEGQGFSVPWTAAQAGHVECLRVIANRCRKDVLRQRRYDGKTLAHAAAVKGRKNVLAFIEEHLGSEFLQITDEGGQTIAHRAAVGGHPNTLAFIHKRLGAAFLKQRDSDGDSIATCAIISPHRAAVKLLTLIERRLGASYLADHRGLGGFPATLAHVAATGGFIDALKCLGEQLGAEFLCKQIPPSKITIAHLAAANGHAAILNFLEARLGIQFLRQLQSNGQSVAHAAAIGGHTEVIDFLVARLGAAFVLKPDGNGNNIAHCALTQRHMAFLAHIESRLMPNWRSVAPLVCQPQRTQHPAVREDYVLRPATADFLRLSRAAGPWRLSHFAS